MREDSKDPEPSLRREAEKTKKLKPTARRRPKRLGVLQRFPSDNFDPQSRPNVKFLCVLATGAGLIALIILYLAGAPFFRSLGKAAGGGGGNGGKDSSRSRRSPGGTRAPSLRPTAAPTSRAPTSLAPTTSATQQPTTTASSRPTTSSSSSAPSSSSSGAPTRMISTPSPTTSAVVVPNAPTTTSVAPSSAALPSAAPSSAALPSAAPSSAPSPQPTTYVPTTIPDARTVVSRFGALRVNANAVESAETGQPVQVAGMSFFWSNTGWEAEEYYDRLVVKELAQVWNVSIVRAAMGVEDFGGYVFDPAGNEARVRTVVEAAIEFGVYVIVDWHSHNAELYEAEAVDFFTRMAQDYGAFPNVVFEIYNEPIGATWPTIKAYAEVVVAAIREHSENLVLVGTPTYSQRLDQAADDPILTDANVAYVLHFYAATHGDDLRAFATTALDAGLAVFASEWGSVSADGNGQVDAASVETWMQFLAEHAISHCNWSVNDKDEGASALIPGTLAADLPWTLPADLTPSGRIVYGILQDAAEALLQ